MVLVAVAAVALFALSGLGSTAAAGAAAEKLNPIEAIGGPKGTITCQCYDAGFWYAGTKGANVMSPRYETGYQQCRSIGKQAAGQAWTAGWNAYLAKKPYEASCRRYKQRRQRNG